MAVSLSDRPVSRLDIVCHDDIGIEVYGLD